MPTSRPLAAESAILVEAPRVPSTPPQIRRSVSEGGGLPPNATAVARSEFAIVEEEEVEPRSPSPATLRQPVPKVDKYPGVRPTTTSSGLALSLARSQPSSPSVQARSDPLNPFAIASSPPSADALVSSSPIVSPPATDFEPTITPAGAVPAFLPSGGGSAKKSTLSASGSVASTTSHTSSPRYVRSTPRAALSSSSTTISVALPISPASASTSKRQAQQQQLASSPASTAGSYTAFPRSASSGSSILSASMMRRAGGAGGLPGAFPSSFGSGGGPSGSASISLEKAQATQETQTGDSKWDKLLLEEDLAKASRDDGAIKRASTVGRKAGVTATKGHSAGTGGSSANRRAASMSSSSVLDALTGKKASVGGAEGEMRKLLRK